MWSLLLAGMAAALLVAPAPAHTQATAIREALRSPDPALRQAAARRFAGETLDVRLRDRFREAVPFLIEVLKDPDPEVVQGIAIGLGHLEDPRAIRPLVRLLTHPDPLVRQAAGGALEHFVVPEAVVPLLEVLPDPRARSLALIRLQELGPLVPVTPLIQALSHPDAQVRQGAAEALAIRPQPAPEAVPALIVALADLHGGIRRAAAQALGRIGAREAVPALVARLTDPEVEVRQEAARALGKGGREAVGPLLLRLQDPAEDRAVRLQAAQSLRLIGDPSAVQPMIAVLADDDRKVRQELAWVLSHWDNDPIVARAIIEALGSEKPRIRRGAATALTIDLHKVLTLGPAGADLLLPALESGDVVVRRAAAQAIARLVKRKLLTETSTERLQRRLADERDPETRRWIEAALRAALASSLMITTAALPPGEVGQPYLFTLQAEGGQPPYTWSLHPAAFEEIMTPFPLGLPPGLSLQQDGTITGVPTREREVLVPLLVTDSLGERASRLLPLLIHPPSGTR